MRIVIIGNGIAGITTARFARKLSDHEITVISSESDYFIARTALMYVYMGHIRRKDLKPYEDWFWEKNRISLIRDHVEECIFSEKTLRLRSGQTVNYDKLVIACGSKPNFFNWPGQDLQGVGGLYAIQDLDYMEEFSSRLERAVVVGGGLIGIEMAEMFHTRKIPVTMLVREKSYWDMVLPPEESEMINRHILRHGIDLKLETELREIKGDQSGRVNGVVTSYGQKIPCGFVGITTGVSPNIEWLRDTELETDRGILVNTCLETNIPDVYAAGDCIQLRKPDPGRKAIEAVWYAGRMQGETLAYHMLSQPTAYHPGIWFNSAKFFDIEYQVYGDVPAQSGPAIDSIYWEHKDGLRSIRIVFDRGSRMVSGFNFMGIRARHEVCEKWIREKAPLEKVLSDLPVASFDPESSRQYHKPLLEVYSRKFNSTIPVRKKRSHDQAFHFLHGNTSSTR